MKTISVNLYEFAELGEKAKAYALHTYLYFNAENDWWSNVYDDAERIGLQITGFDIDRGNFCNGEWMNEAISAAKMIINEHGDTTPSYMAAQRFLALESVTEENEDAFLRELLRIYRELLKQEYDYLTSDAAVIDAFICNDFLFTANGKRANDLEQLTNNKLIPH